MPLSTVKPIDLWIGAPDPRQAWAAVGPGTTLGYFVAFQVFRPVTVTTARFHVDTQAGSMDLGIYSDDGAGNLTLVASTGSFSTPAAGAASRALTASASLVPGVRYYTALRVNGASSFYRTATGVNSGYLSDEKLASAWATAFPLPSTTTFAGVSFQTCFLIYFT